MSCVLFTTQQRTNYISHWQQRDKTGSKINQHWLYYLQRQCQWQDHTWMYVWVTTPLFFTSKYKKNCSILISLLLSLPTNSSFGLNTYITSENRKLQQENFQLLLKHIKKTNTVISVDLKSFLLKLCDILWWGI